MNLRAWHAAGLVAVASAIGAMVILQVTDHVTFRLAVFRYLLFTQDFSGLALLAALALLACIPATHAPALKLVAAIGRHPWRVAAIAFAAMCLGTLVAAHNHALAGDEYLTLMQSRIFAAGRLTGQYPPDLTPWLMTDYYRFRWIMVNEPTGAIAATYWPGFALVLAPFSLLGIPWACNPLLAALSLVLIGRLAEKLTGEAPAAGWAMLLALASPGFTSQPLSWFSMPAHLLVNLLYVWLLVERTPRRLFYAGLVGSAALLLHNPVPHLLFAAPWLVWLAWAPGARRRLLPLALGYLPALILGLAWAVFIRVLHGFIFFAPWPSDGQWLNELGNFLWYWHFRLGGVFGAPTDFSLAGRFGELVRLWAWAAPGLPLLAAAGWWLGRRNPHLALLGVSFAFTLVCYFFVSFDQGYGWGARYLHPAFGALPILGAVAILHFQALRGWMASAAVLSLVLATALRWHQIDEFITEHLSRRPEYTAGAKQLVLVKYDQKHYTQDLAQNDPFLRDPVIFLISRSPREDEEMLRTQFPRARQVSSDWRGQVWRLD